MKKYVTYIRVSTRKQDLGMDVQQDIINNYITTNDVVIASYSEKESAKNNNRIELNKAMKHAKDTDSILLIAKLDRLSRNVAFISALMESKIKFYAIDLGEATAVQLHIYATFAEMELTQIKNRTKSALQIIKNNITNNGYHLSKSGNKITKLGNDTPPTLAIRNMAANAVQERILNDDTRNKARAFAKSLKANGLNGVAITKALNDNCFRTANGKVYYHQTAMKLLK